MITYTDYKIITDTDLDDFEYSVQEILDLGYILIGSPFMAGAALYQAVGKPTKQSIKEKIKELLENSPYVGDSGVIYDQVLEELLDFIENKGEK